MKGTVMAVNLMLLDEKRFEGMCQALLHEEFPRFQAFSAPDCGMHGYDSDSGTVFQAYFPEREPRKDKIHADIEKAKAQGDGCKRWVLLLPKNPTPGLVKWLRTEEQSCRFSIEVWGKTKIHALLQKHKAVRERFFPSEWRKELRRIAKGKGPREGDAGPGLEITAKEREELREMVERLAEDEAKRKKRKVRNSDFQREYGEFNAHFTLSSYGRLPREKMGEARKYFNDKLYARREREPLRLKKNRMVGGIKGIKAKLGMGDAHYRALLLELTGKRTTTEMDMKEIERVFERFKELQGQEDAEA
jgi:hypothetical protein